MDKTDGVDVAVIGAGNVGIAVAYYLAAARGLRHVALIDSRDPMSLTSAQSGENYRNWWPHSVMTAFTDHSTALMEQIDLQSGGRLNMTRGGYALVSRRRRPEDLIESLYRGYGDAPERVRLRESACADYQPPRRAPWSAAPDGVDVLLDRALIRRTFPSYAKDVETVIHIRRAGSISAQQLGQFMLENLREKGIRVRRAEVSGIGRGATGFELELQTPDGPAKLHAERIVNAAGPFIQDIAAMVGERLPVSCVFQQKIAFQDRDAAIPRDMPFTIDLDPQTIAWSDEDRELLGSDPTTRRLVEPMNGGMHCRPDGAPEGSWVKLGWAYNTLPGDPHGIEPIDPHFPDILLRAESRLHPQLATYIERLPRGARHYGGYYTQTEENWPLIGPMQTSGAYVAGALSGFGSMCACATGWLCAAWIDGAQLPTYAKPLSSARYADKPLLAELARLGKGSL